MNRGKQICELLKSIRKDIAESYGLDYTPAECDFEGECVGYCEKCDAEIMDLERQLYSKCHFGSGQIRGLFSDYVGQQCLNIVESIRNFGGNNQIQGMVRPFEPIFEKPEAKRNVPDKKKGNNMEKDILSELKEKLCKDNFAKCVVKETDENKIEDYENKFEEIAKILLNGVAIKKGDKKYHIKEIEFYLYNNQHRDIFTYPRICKAGQWFFHSSGVDLSFESCVETADDEYGMFRPVLLDENAFFGGVLIRQIYPADKAPEDAKKYRLDGPHKVEWELFDQFGAFTEMQKLPYLVSREHGSKTINKYKRINLKPSGKTAEQKLKSILDENYKVKNLSDENLKVKQDVLVDLFNEFFEAKYRFTV